MNNPGPTAPIERDVETSKGRLHVHDHPGDGPALVLMHGYPDESGIYRRLIPELTPRRVVTFDFLGHGRSGRAATWPLEPGQRESKLTAVIDDLCLDRPVLVGHDASGPVAVNYALAHADRVGGLALLDTCSGDSATLRFPELIRLLADPHFTPLVDAVLADQNILTWMLFYTDELLREGPADPEGVGITVVLPQFFGGADQPDALAAIRAWTSELFTDLTVQADHIAAGDLAALDVPVTLAFGEHDPCLNRGVAEIDLAEVQGVVLSHGHFDHAGGLAGLSARLGARAMPMVLDPHVWTPRWLAAPGRPVQDLPTLSRRAVIAEGFDVVERRQPSLLVEGSVLITGEVDRTTDFEHGVPPAHQAWTGSGWEPDPPVIDDQALVVHLRGRGLVVLTGCGHAGAVNIVRHAQRLTGVTELHALFGGLHLSGHAFEPVITPTVEALQQARPHVLVPGHCTGWRAQHALAAALPDAWVASSSGSSYRLTAAPAA